MFLVTLNMLIRTAKKEDINDLIKLNRRLCEHIARSDRYCQANKQTEKAFRDFYIRNLPKRNFKYLVAENNKGKIIGYLSAHILKATPFVAPKKIGEILGCIVSKKYKRKGVGKQLVEKIIEWFEKNKVRHIEVEVHSKNKSGIAFWQKMGSKEYIKKMRFDL